MTNRPVIFISAVSKELHTARDLVAKTLLALGYEPQWQDIASTGTGDLRSVLRKWVDTSDAVLQIVGHCYGFGPDTPDPGLGACSYTQYEALYAKQQGKPVYYLLTDDTHPTDGCGCEPKTLHDLQAQYRQQVKGYGHLYHTTHSLVQTELLVRRLKDDLAHLRERSRQHAALVLFLLGLCAAAVLWLIHSHQQDAKELHATKEAVTKTEQKVDAVLQEREQMKQALIKLADTEMHAKQQGEKLTPEELRQRAYATLEKELGLPTGILAKELPAFALELYNRPDTTLLMRARAAYALNKFEEAEKLFLESDAQDKKAFENAQQTADKLRAQRIEALAGAGQSAEAQIHYSQAMEHYRAAAALISRDQEFLPWLKLQNAISGIYSLQGRHLEGLAHTKEVWQTAQQSGQEEAPAVLAAQFNYANALFSSGNAVAAEQEYRGVIQAQERVLGAEHPHTLETRMSLANALQVQAKNAEAEQEYRTVIQIQERVLDAEHPSTLASRDNLANALRAQGKNAEAEQGHRAVLKVRVRVLGAEHPDTLKSRMNLANALYGQAKYAEAEQEYRAALNIMERVLGAEHPDTLVSRNNLAVALRAQGKNAEAEQEHRAVLKLQERVLGAEHPSTLSSRMNLGNALYGQAKYAEAEQEYRAVLKLQERVLGAEHPDVARSCCNLGDCLEQQQNLPEALGFMQRAEKGLTKALGPEHPDTKEAKRIRERIEAAMKAK